MKICLVNKFHTVKGGSETYYFALGEMLEKRGHEVIYFSMKDEKNKTCKQEKYFVEHVDFNGTMSKLQIVKASLRMLYSMEAKKKFEQLIKNERPDIIHLNIFQSQLTGSIVDAAKKYRIPIVYTAHDLKSICPNYQMLNHGKICERCLHGNYINCFKTGCMKDSRAKSLLATMEAEVYKKKKIYQKLDLIITPSLFYKRKIEEAGIAKCPVIHMTNFLPEGTEYKSGNSNGEYFLYFGRLSRENGILTLIQAYEYAKVNRPLYIVGTGPMKEQIEQFIIKKKLQGQVKLLGFKTGQELKNIISNARCICLPSEWYENGPYSIMEAQAVGKPVIVSDNGGLPELVEDGVNGYIVKAQNAQELAEKLLMCDNKEDWKGENIVKWAHKKYNAETYLNTIEQLYRKELEK